jgi:hypothetical protein
VIIQLYNLLGEWAPIAGCESASSPTIWRDCSDSSRSRGNDKGSANQTLNNIDAFAAICPGDDQGPLERDRWDFESSYAEENGGIDANSRLDWGKV